MEEDPSVIKGALLMPVKQLGGNRLKQAGSLPILMNGYELDLSNVPDVVYKHELKIVAKKTDNQEKDLSRGPKNDVAITLRRRVLWSIYTTMLKSNPDFFGTDTKLFFYDCGINFYSINKLLERSDGEKLFQLSLDSLSSNSRDFLGPKVTEVCGKLLACEEVGLKSSGAVDAFVTERERSLQQFLEVALNQKMYHDQDHLLFGNKAYNRPSSHDRPLSGGKVLASGFAKNARFVGDSPEGAMAVAQIDAKKSAFFKEQNLVALVDALCRNRLESLMRDPRTRQKVAKQLKDLVVRTNHLQNNQRSFCIFGITKEGANRVMIEIGSQQMSVEEYFYTKYCFGLRQPNLPCVVQRRVVQGKAPINSYFPMECLDVVRGQRVDIKKQTPDLVEELINNCRLLPSALKAENEKQRRAACITSENPYLHKLGLRVAESPRGADAKKLFPPAIVYGEGGRIEPNSNGDMDWRLNMNRGMAQRRFYRPATAPRRWVVFIFQDALDKESTQRFLAAFVERAQTHGIKLQRPSRLENMDRSDTDFVLDKMKVMHKNGVEFVLFLTKEKRDPVHDTVKFSEVVAAVVTQHVHSKTVQKAISNRGAEMTLDNILMKTNLKLGGISHAISSANCFLRSNQLNTNIMEKTWLRTSRMFIGLDMSHSSPQSLYERQAGIPPSEPTVVGMAHTCGGPFGMRGEYWMQEPRVYTIHCLEEHVVNALNMFKHESHNKSYPEHVVVFRGGVSEGEYAKVMAEEADALRRAFDTVLQGSGKMRLSIVCVQANSNYRLFPEHSNMGNAAQQNVPAGTCVDSAIVHPSQTEFILVPHKSIMGTARPIRCTVLVDDQPRMSLDEVEGITNALCYMHGIVTSPVSLPAHLYAASDLAKRGRNNWKTANCADDDMSMSSGGGEHGRFQNDGSPDFFPTLSSQLAPKLKHKFWA